MKLGKKERYEEPVREFPWLIFIYRIVFFNKLQNVEKISKLFSSQTELLGVPCRGWLLPSQKVQKRG